MIPVAIHEPSLPEGIVAIPVRTRLIVKGDDLAALLREALCGLAQPGDVVAIAETAVAIAQGRFIGAETIRPSRLARVLARRGQGVDMGRVPPLRRVHLRPRSDDLV